MMFFRDDYLLKWEIYIIDVFYAIIYILDTLEQLEYIPVFLRRFPIRKYYTEEGINHPKYLRYHELPFFLSCHFPPKADPPVEDERSREVSFPLPPSVILSRFSGELVSVSNQPAVCRRISSTHLPPSTRGEVTYG